MPGAFTAPTQTSCREGAPLPGSELPPRMGGRALGAPHSRVPEEKQRARGAERAQASGADPAPHTHAAPSASAQAGQPRLSGHRTSSHGVPSPAPLPGDGWGTWSCLKGLPNCPHQQAPCCSFPPSNVQTPQDLWPCMTLLLADGSNNQSPQEYRRNGGNLPKPWLAAG